MYIQEAHAVDEWRMGQPLDIEQHKSIEDRHRAMLMTKRELNLKLPIFVDAVTHGCGRPEHYNRCSRPNFERLYAAWPLRMCVLDSNGVVLHKGVATEDIETMFGAVRAAIERAVLGSETT